MRREDLIYQILGRVSVELPGMSRQNMRQLHFCLSSYLPDVSSIKETVDNKGFVDRSDVEKFLSTETFSVRTTTLVAKAITKSMKN